MRVTLVVAADENGLIGRGNTLPWRLPADLQRFKAATMGHAVVMGRRTFESLKRPLPGRLNIVLSRSLAGIEGCQVARSLDEALALGAEHHDEVMIIGGAAVYAEALPLADRILLTIVDGRFSGDAWLARPAAGAWGVRSHVRFDADEANVHATTLYDLVRPPGGLPLFVWPSPP